MDMQTSSYDEATTEASNKRKRDTLEDHEGPEQKKVHIENGTLGIEALHRDVGPLYRLSSTPYPKAPVDHTIDLFKVYSLEDIAKDVARGGDNPVKMGKTYKKHMRTMGLSGKFDAVKKEDDEMGLFDMLKIPEDEWNEAETLGKDLHAGLSTTARSNLAQAMSMSKGRIPKELWDTSLLALPEPSAPVAARQAAGLNRKALGHGSNLTAAPPRQTKAAAEPARPQRKTKKRSYTDETFEGYEGYTEGVYEETVDDGAFRPGDEDRQKRRKKDSNSYHFQPTMRHASFGPGTVGA